ncbi:MAG: DUF2281 domain-containing protein [Cyanobacteria bacterium P01_F01_bin.86]
MGNLIYAVFNLLDQVQLTEPIPLSGDMSNALELPETAPVGTIGTIVEVLEPNEAFWVELFGDWVTLQAPTGLLRTEADNPEAFRETLGVETVHSHQMTVRQSSNAVKMDLFRLLDEMPETLLKEVQTFAEFLQHKQQQQKTTP